MPRLAVAQTVCHVGDVARNLDTAQELVAQAGREKLHFSKPPQWREAAAPYLADRQIFSWKRSKVPR